MQELDSRRWATTRNTRLIRQIHKGYTTTTDEAAREFDLTS